MYMGPWLSPYTSRTVAQGEMLVCAGSLLNSDSGPTAARSPCCVCNLRQRVLRLIHVPEPAVDGEPCSRVLMTIYSIIPADAQTGVLSNREWTVSLARMMKSDRLYRGVGAHECNVLGQGDQLSGAQ